MRQLRDEPGRLESLATGRQMGGANGLAGGDAAAAAAAGGGKDSEEEKEDSDPAAAAAEVDAMDADPAPEAATALAAALGAALAGTPAAAPAAASDEPASQGGAIAAAAGAGAAPAAKGVRGRGRARATKVAKGRGSSGYKGVYGDGPWAAQIALGSKRVSFLQAPWNHSRAAFWNRSWGGECLYRRMLVSCASSDCLEANPLLPLLPWSHRQEY